MNVWHGYNDDENRVTQEQLRAAWQDWVERHHERMQRAAEAVRAHGEPVKGFDSAAEADAFHADVERFLKGGQA